MLGINHDDKDPVNPFLALGSKCKALTLFRLYLVIDMDEWLELATIHTY